MRLALIPAALCCALPLRALDLTPHSATINADGVAMKTVYFQDGKKRVFITPPNGWIFEGQTAFAALRNPAAMRSSVVFALSPKPLLPTDAEQLKATRAAVLATVPKGAQNAAVESEAANPLPINGWSSQQFRIGYDLIDTHFIKSVLIIKLNNFEELQVMVSAPMSDYTKASSAAMTCLKTWHKE